MGGKVFRLEPKAPIQAMQTYTIARGKEHLREVTCAQIECKAHVNGWQTLIDESTERGKTQGAYIRHGSGRRFTEDRNDAGVTVFTFAPGQTCFGGKHYQTNERPPIYSVRGGDWRGSTGRIRQFENGDDWVDSFAANLDNIATIRKRG